MSAWCKVVNRLDMAFKPFFFFLLRIWTNLDPLKSWREKGNFDQNLDKTL